MITQLEYDIKQGNYFALRYARELSQEAVQPADKSYSYKQANQERRERLKREYAANV